MISGISLLNDACHVQLPGCYDADRNAEMKTVKHLQGSKTELWTYFSFVVRIPA